MICYRDMTFCPFWQDCTQGAKCPRAATTFVFSEARRLRIGVCQFMERPDCWTYDDPNGVTTHGKDTGPD